MKHALVTLALFAIGLPTLATGAVINVPADHATIPAAVAAASPTDQIVIADGTYTLTSTLDVDKSLTITGQSEAGVIVQIDTGTSWGIYLHADDITLESMTLDVITTGAEAGYAIHADGTDNLPNGWTGLTIQQVTVQGDATSGPKRRSGIDVHGYNSVVIDDCDSSDASWGVGLALSGCIDVAVSNLTTSNNAWGSAAVYVSRPIYMNRPSDNVVFDGATMFVAEKYIFQQDEYAMVSTDVSVTGYEYLVYNDTFRPDAAGFTMFQDTFADASTLALAFTGYEDGSSMQRLADSHWVVDAGMSIQTAVDDASSGGTVEVLAGTFIEQVEIDKDLNLEGAGVGSTVVQAFASMPLFFTTSANNTPIIYAHDAADIVIRDMTVDGAGLGNSNARFFGIAYRNAGGGVYDCEIKDTRNTPLDGGQHGNAFYLYNDDTVARSMDVQGCTVYGFQKNGITLNSLGGTPLTVDVSGNSVTGDPTLTYDNGDPAQNGMQVYGDLITGAVDNNAVDGIAYDNTNNPIKYVATSILDYYSGVDMTNNVITGGHVGVYKYDAYGSVSDNDMTIEKIGVSAWGIIASDPPHAVPSPLDEIVAKSSLQKKAVLNVLVDGNTVAFSGGDNTGTFGIEGDAGFGTDDIALTVTNNTVTGFEVGVDIYQCQSSCSTGVFTSVAVNNNSFTGNDIGIRSNLDYLTVAGTCNWYGDVSGPAATVPVNPGTGDPVEGDILYWPWLDGPGGNCDQYLVVDVIAANPSGEISACNPCFTVPIDFTRTDTTPLRGVSVTFQLSSELELCTGTGDIQIATGAGSLFDGFTNTTLFVIDNGSKSYTADVSLLGTPCGTTTDGSVVTVGVKAATGITTDTTGTITVTAVTVRDCSNGPLPGYPGAPASITINNGDPGVVSDLAASQVKTGNDTDGTTKVTLTWTDPTDPDLETIEVYRKGFGFYPEYDDLGGSAPAAPADPGTAISNGWTLVANVAAGTGTYVDEPGTRDFWYYVVFAEDGCNYGGVSNRTGGTLNYHLGDIDPATTGNNGVLTADVSALGIAYGSSDGDGNYNAAADVGPTTDFFVNARPTTDDEIQFEDLMMFAINYAQVSKRPVGLASAGRSELHLGVPTLPAVGETFEVLLQMAADGSVHGLSANITWNHAQVEYLGFVAGELMAAQGTVSPVFSPVPGRIDAAVFGTSDGILGEGTLAALRFRVREAGDAAFGFGNIDARDASNQDATLTSTISGTPSAVALLQRTEVLPNIPNPFNPATSIHFVVGQTGPVSVRIYSLQGRLVRTLVNTTMDVGPHQVTWFGRDESDRAVASGTYVVRVEAADRTHSRNISLLK